MGVYHGKSQEIYDEWGYYGGVRLHYNLKSIQ